MLVSRDVRNMHRSVKDHMSMREFLVKSLKSLVKNVFILPNIPLTPAIRETSFSSHPAPHCHRSGKDVL